jgi:hypothetical protein
MTFTRSDYEMAAKAAGIEHDGVGYVSPNGLPMNWNPLDDDGDALRLAVALGLLLTIGRVGILVRKFCIVDIEELPGDDPCAATRLAIFRAAIAIGRDMP